MEDYTSRHYWNWVEEKAWEEDRKMVKNYSRVMNQLLVKANPVKPVLTIKNVIALKRFAREMCAAYGNRCTKFIKDSSGAYMQCSAYISEYGCSNCDEKFSCLQCGNPVLCEGHYCSSYCNYMDNKDLYREDYNRYY